MEYQLSKNKRKGNVFKMKVKSNEFKIKMLLKRIENIRKSKFLSPQAKINKINSLQEEINRLNLKNELQVNNEKLLQFSEARYALQEKLLSQELSNDEYLNALESIDLIEKHTYELLMAEKKEAATELHKEEEKNARISESLERKSKIIGFDEIYSQKQEAEEKMSNTSEGKENMEPQTKRHVTSQQMFGYEMPRRKYQRVQPTQSNLEESNQPSDIKKTQETSDKIRIPELPPIDVKNIENIEQVDLALTALLESYGITLGAQEAKIENAELETETQEPTVDLQEPFVEQEEIGSETQEQILEKEEQETAIQETTVETEELQLETQKTTGELVLESLRESVRNGDITLNDIRKVTKELQKSQNKAKSQQKRREDREENDI